MSVEHRTRCPYCWCENPLVSPVDTGDARPVDDDVSVCFGCAEPAIFDSKHPDGIRRPTRAERAEVLEDERVRAAADAILRLAAR